jgi:hypothetical protein
VFRVTGKADERIAFLVDLLDNPKDEVDGALAVLALTDPVTRVALGQIRAMPDADVYHGPYASLIMLPFLRPFRARFNDTTFGAWYAADDQTTAYYEKRFHLIRWLSNSRGKPYELWQRIVSANLTAPLLHVRRGEVPDEVYDPDPDHYAAANTLAREVRANGAHGLLYDSVRRHGFACVAIFRPSIISDIMIERDLRLEWDGDDLRGFTAIA